MSVASTTPDIMQHSPLDQSPPASPVPAAQVPALEVKQEALAQRWVPSRFNTRAVAEDGRLIVWNVFRGTILIFKAEQAAAVADLLDKDSIESREEGLVKYLADHGMLITQETDEYRQFQLAFGQSHYRLDVLELILFSSEDCNFRCTYCYEDFSRGTMRPEVRQGVKKLIEKRIPFLNQLGVDWFGGEPLYGWQAIEDIAPFVFQKAQEYRVPYTSSMTTNGYLLTPEVVDKLFSWGVRRFQITLGGAPADHDKCRPARNGQGTFWTIMENLKGLARRKDEFFVSLRVNYDGQNHSRLDQLFDVVAKELGSDSRFRVKLRPVEKLGGANDDALEICAVQERVETLRRVTEQAMARGLQVDNIKHLNKVGGQACYSARPYNFLIGSDGQVMKCTVALRTNSGNCVGHLTPEGELRLNPDRLALWTEPVFETDSVCRQCPLLPGCHGMNCVRSRLLTGARACSPLRATCKNSLLAALSEHDARARAK